MSDVQKLPPKKESRKICHVSFLKGNKKKREKVRIQRVTWDTDKGIEMQQILMLIRPTVFFNFVFSFK